MQPCADRRVDPVRADEDVRVERDRAPARALKQLGAHALAGLLEARQRQAAAHRAGSEAVAHRAEQHALQLAAVNRVLRPAVARRAAARLAVDAIAETVVVDELGGGDRACLERLAQSELGQLADGVRKQVDAGADRVDAARGLDDRDVDPGVVQAERGRQTADPASGDEDVHAQRGAPKPAAGNCSSTIISGRPPPWIA